MTHLTEETILALRDQEPVDDKVKSHVEGCAVCAQALRDARERAEAIEHALAALTAPLPVGAPAEEELGTEPAPVIPIDRGRGDVGAESSGRQGRRDAPGGPSIGRGRRDAPGGLSVGHGRRDVVRGTRVRGGFPAVRWLGRAAVLVLIGAGALSALPGPFNGWIPRVFPGNGAPDAPAEAVGLGVGQVGGRMDVGAGPVAVQLQGVPPGTLIDVRRVAGRAVGVLAATGSEFTYGSGEVRASVAGGPVTVELPEGVVPATVVVNGGIYLVVRASGMEIAGPRTASGEESLVTFRVPN